MIKDTTVEYAVEVPGRGYVGWMGTVQTKELEMGVNRDDAEQLLKATQGKYISMGCLEIAKTLHIVSRTVTVTRSAWVAEAKVATA